MKEIGRKAMKTGGIGNWVQQGPRKEKTNYVEASQRESQSVLGTRKKGGTTEVRPPGIEEGNRGCPVPIQIGFTARAHKRGGWREGNHYIFQGVGKNGEKKPRRTRQCIRTVVTRGTAKGRGDCPLSS